MQRRILLGYILASIFSSWKLYAQQTPSYSNYLNTIQVYNPAYAGATGNISSTFLYRNQWNKMPNAPMTRMVALHAPIVHNSVGIGGFFNNDQLGPLNIITLSALYAYRINFKRGILSMGLQGGIKQYRLTASMLDPKDQGDGSLPTSDASYLLPDAGAGIYFQSEKLQLGFSTMQLITRRISIPAITLSPAFYLVTSYTLNSTGYIHVVSSIFVKASGKKDLQADLSLFAKSPEVTMGFSYRTLKIFSFQLALHLNKLVPALQEDITFGYAYDHFSSSSTLGNGANEFFLQYNFKINPTVKKVSKQPKSHAPKFF